MWSTCQDGSSLTHTDRHYMVVLFGTSLTDSLLPWRLPSIIFSGKLGGSQETATLGFFIKLHILTVFSTDLYVFLTVFQDLWVKLLFASRALYFIQHQCVYSSQQQSPLCSQYMKLYFEKDHICTDFARHLRISDSSKRDLDIESMLQIICCN